MFSLHWTVDLPEEYNIRSDKKIQHHFNIWRREHGELQSFPHLLYPLLLLRVIAVPLLLRMEGLQQRPCAKLLAVHWYLSPWVLAACCSWVRYHPRLWVCCFLNSFIYLLVYLFIFMHPVFCLICCHTEQDRVESPSLGVFEKPLHVLLKDMV